MSISISAVDS